MDWERYFLDNLPLINSATAYVCGKYGLTGADEEDFRSVVMIKLIEDDYAVLRKFENRAALKTYLIIVIKRLYADQMIHETGKWRPSVRARQGGEPAILLERLISRDGVGEAEALAIVRQKYPELDSHALEALPSSIVRRRVQRAEEVERTEEMPEPASGISAEDELLTNEREMVECRTNAIVNQELGSFPAEDRLVMELRYLDGMKVSAIASRLKLDQKQLYRRIDRLCAKLKKALDFAGIKSSDIRDMLTNGADALLFDLHTPEDRPKVPQ